MHQGISKRCRQGVEGEVDDSQPCAFSASTWPVRTFESVKFSEQVHSGMDCTPSLIRNANSQVFHEVDAFFWDLFESDNLHTLFFASWYIWGCTSLSEARALGHSQMGAEHAAEDRAGFGQLVPRVLLLLPLLALFDSYAQHSADNGPRC